MAPAAVAGSLPPAVRGVAGRAACVWPLGGYMKGAPGRVRVEGMLVSR